MPRALADIPNTATLTNTTGYPLVVYSQQIATIPPGEEREIDLGSLEAGRSTQVLRGETHRERVWQAIVGLVVSGQATVAPPVEIVDADLEPIFPHGGARYPDVNTLRPGLPAYQAKTAGPVMKELNISASNDYIDVAFSEGVYGGAGVPAVPDLAIVDFIQQPAQGDTLVLGDGTDTWTFEFDDGGAPTGIAVAIGTDLGETVANFVAAVVGEEIPGLAVEVSGENSAQLAGDAGVFTIEADVEGAGEGAVFGVTDFEGGHEAVDAGEIGPACFVITVEGGTANAKPTIVSVKQTDDVVEAEASDLEGGEDILRIFLDDLGDVDGDEVATVAVVPFAIVNDQNLPVQSAITRTIGYND